jgi:hypothetical protein
VPTALRRRRRIPAGLQAQRRLLEQAA